MSSTEKRLVPVRLAVIGMGGFAGSHHNIVADLERQGRCRLVATCDPAMDRFVERQKNLDFIGRGVKCFPDYRVMLEQCKNQLDMVTIPTPIHLHASMHRDAVQAGLAVYLEKPPTLDFRELKAMETVDTKVRFKTNVAFNFIVDSKRQALKKRLLQGDFGRLKRVCFSGLSPRNAAYYQRAEWAGRLKIQDALVLDSPMGNAMAHYVHNALYWAGLDGLHDWAGLKSVMAECYRAHAIEGADTMFVEAVTDKAVKLSLVLSHACATPGLMAEWFECEKASVFYGADGAAKIRWADGRIEKTEPHGQDLFKENFAAFFDYIQGVADRPVTSLADSEPFVFLNDLVYVSSEQIATVPETCIIRTPESGGGESIAIAGIEHTTEQFFKNSAFPAEQGMAWGRPQRRRVGLDSLKELHAVIDRMIVEKKP